MLATFESRLVQALADVLPADVTMAAGPVRGPPTGETRFVQVHARRLTTQDMPHAGDDPKADRSPAFLSQVQRWELADQANQQRDFPLSVEGKVVEVQAPPGLRVKRGDDYEVHDGQIRFYRAPGATVMACVQSASAHGYRDTRRSEMELELTVWGQTLAATDELLGLGLTTVAAAATDLDIIEGSYEPYPGVTLRLCSAVLSLRGIKRTLQQVDGTDYFLCRAAFRILANLEVTVALGEAEPEGIIRQIEYDFGRPPPNYLISAVRFAAGNGAMAYFKVHPFHNMTRQEAKVWSRERLIGNLTAPSGMAIATVYWDANRKAWQTGSLVRAVFSGGDWHLRSEPNDIPEDNLGNLPRF